VNNITAHILPAPARITFFDRRLAYDKFGGVSPGLNIIEATAKDGLVTYCQGGDLTRGGRWFGAVIGLEPLELLPILLDDDRRVAPGEGLAALNTKMPGKVNRGTLSNGGSTVTNAIDDAISFV